MRTIQILRSTRAPSLILTLLVLVACPRAAARQLVPNGTFDHDLSGWPFEDYADTTITWDAFGNPGGSLRVTTSSTDPGLKFITGPCISEPEGHYVVTADVYRPSPGSPLFLCRVALRGWTGPGCTGQDGITLTPPPPPLDTWFQTSMDQDIAADGPIRSFAVVLDTGRNNAPGESTCYFDNVRLTGPPVSTLEIPTLSAPALAMLALLVGLTGWVVVARRSDHRVPR